MKSTQITPGVYFDGKKRLRRVIGCVEEVVVFEKITVHSPQSMNLDRPQRCSFADFRKWAKVRLEEHDLPEVLLLLWVAQTHLSNAQKKALLAANNGELVLGKVRTSLLEKGLIICPIQSRGAPVLTRLGERMLEEIKAREGGS